MTAEKANDVFTKEILPTAPRQTGFVTCQRFVDHRTGEFKILSLWESDDDCLSSHNNDEYYADGLNKLRPYTRYGMFKTEHFQVWKLHPDDDNVVTSPYARVSVMELKEGNDAVSEADENLRNAHHELKTKPGFYGLQRLLGTGDAEGTYMIISYWDSHAALVASQRGTEYYNRFLGTFADKVSEATGFRKSVKLGTDMSTHQFEHMRYEHPRAVAPLLPPGSTLAATFQLACISFGVGIFVMPYVFGRVSLLMGCIILAVCGIFSDFCMQIMLHAADVTGAISYEDVMYHAFGPAGRAMALVSLALSTLTANCSHMQFVSSMFVEMQGPEGGIMKTLVGPNLRAQQFTAMLIFGGLALPLCFKRQLSDLRFVSMGVVLFCICGSGVVAFKSLLLILDGTADSTHGTVPWDVPSAGVMLDAVPAVAFGFSSIVELFHVRAEIKKPKAMGRCAHVATALICMLYLAVGLIGALAFENPGPNLLENFPDSNVVAFLRLGIIVMITLLYPIINFPCVQAVDSLIAGRFGAPSMRRWKIMSVLGFVFVLLIDTLVTDLSDVFSLSGALGLGLVAYVLPCSAAIMVSCRQEPSTGTRTMRVACAALILVAGLVLTFGSTAWIIRGVALGHPE